MIHKLNWEKQQLIELINRVNKSKTLGVVIDNHLTWNTQIDNITKKVSILPLQFGMTCQNVQKRKGLV